MKKIVFTAIIMCFVIVAFTSCSTEATDSVTACSHDVVVEEAIAPTCTEDGKTEGKHCAKCGEIITAQVVVERLGHTEVTDEAVAATCTTEGKTEGKHCSVCNEVILPPKVTEKLAHTEGEWVIDKKATKTEDGAKHLSCSVCGEHIKDEIIYATGSEGFNYRVNTDGQTCIIVNMGTCSDTDVIIPAYINGYKVTGIRGYAFKGSNVKSVVVPETITRIGEFAFIDCTTLESVVLPESLVAIEGYAFQSCRNLKTIKFSGNSNLKSIGNAAFFGCKGLNEFHITDIGAWVETEFTDYTSNPCNGAVADMDKYIDIYLNGQLLTDAVIPNGVKRINEYAFHSYKKLETVVIPESVTEIGRMAFGLCDNLRVVKFENNKPLTEVGDKAFFACHDIREIYITDLEAWTKIAGVDTTFFRIDTELYLNGNLLTELIIPDSITSISDLAFYGHKDITCVVIPEIVTEIGEEAFSHCSNLSRITYKGTKAQWKALIKGEDWIDSTLVSIVNCSDGSLSVR